MVLQLALSLFLPPPNSGRGKSFRLKLPALLALTGSKQSLPQDDPDEAVVVDFSKHSSESVGLDEAPSSLDNNCLGYGEPEDRQALMEREGGREAQPPITHSSPRTDRARLHLDASFSNCSLTRSRSRESFYSVRRASSVDDIEAMKGEGDKGRGHSRHASTGMGGCRGSRGQAGEQAPPGETSLSPQQCPRGAGAEYPSPTALAFERGGGAGPPAPPLVLAQAPPSCPAGPDREGTVQPCVRLPAGLPRDSLKPRCRAWRPEAPPVRMALQGTRSLPQQ